VAGDWFGRKKWNTNEEKTMDGTRFDGMARTFSATDSRRGMFKTMAAAGLGLGLSSVGLGQALGKGKKGGKKVTARCKKTEECSGKLVCKKANSQHYYEETKKRCCIKEGGRCDQGYECCGVDVICNGGYCQSA
jgi:hypothetical protein